jgi:hypothetical protein
VVFIWSNTTEKAEGGLVPLREEMDGDGLTGKPFGRIDPRRCVNRYT